MTARHLFTVPDLLMSESQPVIREFDMTEADDPQVDLCQGGVREPLEIYVFRLAKIITGGFADSSGELGAADPADAFRLQGNGTGNLRIDPELCTVPRCRVGGNYKCIILLVPCIEARGAPCSALTDGGYAQQVVTPEKRLYSFVQYFLFQGLLLFVPPVSINIKARKRQHPVDYRHHEVIN